MALVDSAARSNLALSASVWTGPCPPVQVCCGSNGVESPVRPAYAPAGGMTGGGLVNAAHSQGSRRAPFRHRHASGQLVDISVPQLSPSALVPPPPPALIIRLNVAQFRPDALRVWLDGALLVVECDQHEYGAGVDEPAGGTLRRKYMVTEDLNVDEIRASLSRAGILTIVAPRPRCGSINESPQPVSVARSPVGTRRPIPVSVTGRSCSSDSAVAKKRWHSGQ